MFENNILVCIFTEGGSQFGFGHVSRCMALYDELESKGVGVKLIINGDEQIASSLGNRNFVLDQWYDKYIDYLDCNLPIYCIIDSYKIDFNTYEGIRSHCIQALYIDDTNRLEYPEGIILNPSIFGNKVNYKRKPNQTYLLGAKYVILRKPFRRSCQRNAKNIVEDILVIMGGADPKNVTPKVLDVLSTIKLEHVRLHIVIGANFTNIEEIYQAIKLLNKENLTCQIDVKLYHNANAEQIFHIMTDCDLAISAAGQTLYELIATKLPFIAIKIATNQSNNLHGMMEAGLIENYVDCIDKKNWQDEFRTSLLCAFSGIQERAVRQTIIEQMDSFRLELGVQRIIERFIQDYEDIVIEQSRL